MSPRSIRRAAERPTQIEARHAAESAPPSKSTGPRTPEGKKRSSQNSFKHGIYAKVLLVQGENAAEFEEVRAKLRAEHQPASTTEEILVDELAQHFWRLRRFRAYEATLWEPETFCNLASEKHIALVLRAASSAERGFHKALATLRQLQKAHRPLDAAPNERETQWTWPDPASPLCATGSEHRQFVPAPLAGEENAEVSANPEAEFVPSFSSFVSPELAEDGLPRDPNHPFYREAIALRERVHQSVSLEARP